MSMEMQLHRHTLTLSDPLRTAHGEISRREIVTVALRGRDGVTGWGECCPLEHYDGVSMERALLALSRHREVVEGWDSTPPPARNGRTARGGALAAGALGADGAALLAACRAADPLPQALAAIDLALWDRAGRLQGKPVAMLLVDAPAQRVVVNATISAPDPERAAAQAACAAAQGFSCVKLKVGFGDDERRVAAVRESLGANVALRLDANGAWSVEEAVERIRALEPFGIELVEEPTGGLEAIRQVQQRVDTPIAIDESADQRGALTQRVGQLVCLKISRCGGIAGLLRSAALVQASGRSVYLASTLDGPLGIAAAVHAAAALAGDGPLPACGLATLPMFEGFERALAPRGGELVPPGGPGLGVSPA